MLFKRFSISLIQPFSILTGIVLLGLALRLHQLDAKPLWLDEILTGLFSTGHRYQDVPLNQLFPLSLLDSLFQVRSGLSCAQIAQTVATESVHPPLFFCLMYAWLNGLHPDPQHWVGVMRLLPALLGTGAIAALYWLNRMAFSMKAGLMGAALMAVSPFAVYLSQEARHYTLPMLLICLSLGLLVQMQQDIVQQRLRIWLWIGWGGINALSLYVHYFCLLALLAQIAALLGWMLAQNWQHRRAVIASRYWVALLLAIVGLSLCYLPWLPTMLSHMSRPETDWLIPYKPDWLDRIAPLYRTVVGWVLMLVVLPVERQPRPVSIGSAGLMLLIALGLSWLIARGFRGLWQDRSLRPATVLLLSFTGCVMLQFFAIVYGLDKDITVVPRYNFVYFPGVCALLGASLAALPLHPRPANRSLRAFLGSARFGQPAVLAIGIISSLIVTSGLAFYKSYYPDRVARLMTFEPSLPLITVVSYQSPQEVALGLSFALEVRQQYPGDRVDQSVRFGFLDHSTGYDAVWQALPRLQQPFPLPLNLWIVASPGMRTKDYPARLRLANPTEPDRPLICRVDPEEFHRIGFPYQLFRCRNKAK